MKNHEYYEELISRSLDSELSPDEERELSRHIASCADCQCMAEAFRALSGALGEELCEPPEGMSERIMAEIRGSELRKKNRRLRPVFAAAACLAVVVLGSFAFRGRAGKMQALTGDTEAFAAVYADAGADNGYRAMSDTAPAPARGMFSASFGAETEEAEPCEEEKAAPADPCRAACPAPEEFTLSESAAMDGLKKLLGGSSTEAEPETTAVCTVRCEADGRILTLYEQPDGTLLYSDSEQEGFFAAECSAEDCRNFVMEKSEK